MDLKEEGLIKVPLNKHWYYAAKLAALKAILDVGGKGVILDVGSGSGFFAREMVASGHSTEAICVDPGYAADSDETVSGMKIGLRREVGPTDAALVLMMDVLEHVDDDVGLVAEYVAKVPSGALFVVTVPAFQFLWSGHDVFLEHRQRYTLQQIEAVLEKGGLVIERGCYVYGTLFPIVVSVRMLRKMLKGADAEAKSDMSDQGAFATACLGFACRVDRALFLCNRLFGLTAMVRARRP